MPLGVECVIVVEVCYGASSIVCRLIGLESEADFSCVFFSAEANLKHSPHLGAF